MLIKSRTTENRSELWLQRLVSCHPFRTRWWSCRNEKLSLSWLCSSNARSRPPLRQQRICLRSPNMSSTSLTLRERRGRERKSPELLMRHSKLTRMRANWSAKEPLMESRLRRLHILQNKIWRRLLPRMLWSKPFLRKPRTASPQRPFWVTSQRRTRFKCSTKIELRMRLATRLKFRMWVSHNAPW